MYKNLFLSLIILLVSRAVSFAQTEPALERVVSLTVQQQTIQQVLLQVQQQTTVVFSYGASSIEADRKVSISVQRKTVRQVLFILFKKTVAYRVKGNYIILQKHLPAPSSETARTEKRSIEGYINNPSTGKGMENASVYSANYNTYTVTDKFGYFKLDLPSNEPLETIKVSKIGFCDTELSASSLDSGFIETQLPDNCPIPLHSDSQQKESSLLSSYILPKEKIAFLRNISDTVFSQIQVSVFPFVGTNALLSGNATNKTAINLTIGYVKEIQSIELGSILNIVRDNVHGIDAAGVGSIIGKDCHGMQAAGVFCVARNVDGAQLAGTANVADSVNGIQFAGTLNVSRAVIGLQASGTVGVAKNVEGAMLAGAVNGARFVNGAAAAGIVNGIQKLDGVAIAGAINVTTEAKGVALAGAINIADTMQGVQITSLLNKARVLNGSQIGLLNIADTCNGIQIGLFNYVKRGYHYFELSCDETFYVNFAFRSGTQYFHSILLAGLATKSFSPTIWTYGYGLGSTIGHRKVRLDFDVSMQHVVPNDKMNNNFLFRAYTGLDIGNPHGRTLAIGISFNSFISQDGLAIAPNYAATGVINNGAMHQKWFGGKIALRW